LAGTDVSFRATLLDQTRFRDRSDAGRQLARRLLHLRDSRPVVLALPRGGVPVAAEVAQTLGASLDILFVRKIGAPGHRELALAAIVDGANPLTVINEDVRKAFSVSDNYIAMESARELREIKRRSAAYLRGRSPPELRDRTVIIVDDGIATGATVKVALQALRVAGAAKRVLAVPVAPRDVAAELQDVCDELVVLRLPHLLGAVGTFYDIFNQLEDTEVVAILDDACRRVQLQEGWREPDV
jgi:putative phosphoribosyl transferase